MKRVIFSLLFIFSIASNIYANDLISIATNGIYNKDSLDVRELNDEEMKRVVGGASIYNENNIWYRVYTNGVKDNSGSKVYYLAYYRLFPTSTNELSLLSYDDGSGRYIPAVSVGVDLRGNSIQTLSIIGFDPNNPVRVRSTNKYYADKLLSENYGRLRGQVSYLAKEHARSWKYSRSPK
ncbi:hypothetical protein [Helicobacter sp. WB40]|uniref:hypothetical protein n=1 Tax=Helicobacter sp. WB40 TaxID=3004130 RepID=UPI0022EBE53D|nr:hypothetical protein [Helicobacter sp. WB40]MDA3967087.1 hypothetical protein [Helicobacter sp. WB40]